MWRDLTVVGSSYEMQINEQTGRYRHRLLSLNLLQEDPIGGTRGIGPWADGPAPDVKMWQNVTDEQVDRVLANTRKWLTENAKGAMIVICCNQSEPPMVQYEALGPNWVISALLDTVIWKRDGGPSTPLDATISVEAHPTNPPQPICFTVQNLKGKSVAVLTREQLEQAIKRYDTMLQAYNQRRGNAN
jgi:hypothetical protein